MSSRDFFKKAAKFGSCPCGIYAVAGDENLLRNSVHSRVGRVTMEPVRQSPWSSRRQILFVTSHDARFPAFPSSRPPVKFPLLPCPLHAPPCGCRPGIAQGTPTPGHGIHLLGAGSPPWGPPELPPARPLCLPSTVRAGRGIFFSSFHQRLDSLPVVG